MKWTRAALLLTAHAAVACAPPPSSIGKPPSVVVTPATRIVSQPVGVASAETCVPRVAANGGAFFALDASERSKRVQAALRLKYREPEQSGAKDDPSERAEARPNFRFVFELLPKRWGAEGPVPWQEQTLPRLQRFTEPLALYATELWTGEFEYPWVSVLVVAREAQDQLELNVVMSPDFSGDTQVIESLLLDACAGSANLRSQLALAVRELYALGGAQPGEETTQDGSCTVTDFHLYQDVWRYLAIDFSSSGRVRHVYAFNPMDEEDSLRRRTLCTEHAAEP
ncbi:MAG TPA: hypothetical protein VER11_24640 [Polyangiaceae bacterium]|nr:hypothetical protein [Polyangiaceae bacterium]